MSNVKYKSIYSGQQIDDAITKVNNLDLENYYDKNEIDEKLSNNVTKGYLESNYLDQNEIETIETFEENAPNVQVSVGNLKVGTKIAGLTLKSVLKMMLYGDVTNPQLVAPSLKCIANTLMGVAGSSMKIKGKLIFDRGKIDPAYSTNGFRSGEPISYFVNDELVDGVSLDQPFETTISKLSPSNNSINCIVKYAGGEQPLNSVGAPYANALPAGEIEEYINIVGLTLSFSGFDGGEIKENGDLSNIIPVNSQEHQLNGLFGNEEQIMGYQITTPEPSAKSEVPIVLLPENISLVGVQGWNSLVCGWSWFNGDTPEESIAALTWIPTDESISKEIDGVAVNYKKYRYNIDQYGPMGENYFRFFIKEVGPNE